MHAWMMDACMTIAYNYQMELYGYTYYDVWQLCMHTGLGAFLLAITTTIIQPYKHCKNYPASENYGSTVKFTSKFSDAH